MIPPPPFETVRAQSELFAFQFGQWETIRNSQLIGRYKEMSVWHQVNLMIYPPGKSDRDQSDLFTVQCCHWHSKPDIPPGSLEQQISLITTSTTMHIYIYRRQIVVKNGNFTFLLTSTGQQWQFYVAICKYS